MTQQNKLYEAAKNYLKPQNTFEEDDAAYDALQQAVIVYEQSIEQPKASPDKLAEIVLREYVKFKDVNGSKSVSILPLTIVDAMVEFADRLNEQPEAITWKKNAYESALDYLSEMGYGTGTNFSLKGVASLLADFASQQTSSKDKQLNVQQSHIDEQDQLIFEQAEEIKELKEAISELIQVKDWKDRYGKDEHYLKAMPIAWENVRKLIIPLATTPTTKVNNH